MVPKMFHQTARRKKHRQIPPLNCPKRKMILPRFSLSKILRKNLKTNSGRFSDFHLCFGPAPSFGPESVWRSSVSHGGFAFSPEPGLQSLGSNLDQKSTFDPFKRLSAVATAYWSRFEVRFGTKNWTPHSRMIRLNSGIFWSFDLI